MRTVFLDPLSDPGWSRLVHEAPDASVFHHPLWLRLLRAQYRYPLAAVCVLDDRGVPVAGLPVAAVASRLTGRRLVALPFSDRCEVLFGRGDDADQSARAVTLLAEALHRERARRGGALEVRTALPEAGELHEHAILHLVDLSDGLEAVQARWTSMVRRNVRKARRVGVAIEQRTDREALEAFFALHVETRRRLGVPTQPKGFILRLEELLSQGLGFVSLARYGRDVAAAAVFLQFGSTLVYKYGASNEALLRTRPTNLVFAETIAWACGEGFTALDMGRTDFSGKGLIAFKESWGADALPLIYSIAGGRGPGLARGGPPAANRALATVIRRGPPVVGRTIGSLLYRHAA